MFKLKLIIIIVIIYKLTSLNNALVLFSDLI